MDFSGFQEKYNQAMRDRSLDPNDPIDCLVYNAYMETKHLTSLKSKISTKKQSAELLSISKQSEELSQKIANLHYRYRQGISFSLIEREECNITYVDTEIADFLKKLSRAAIHANEVMLAPIPQGKYNAFLSMLVERYFQSPSLDLLFMFYPAKTESKKKSILKNRWEKNRIKITKQAATIIAFELGNSTANSYEAAVKTLENNMKPIVEERIEWALKIHKITQSRGKNPPEIS